MCDIVKDSGRHREQPPAQRGTQMTRTQAISALITIADGFKANFSIDLAHAEKTLKSAGRTFDGFRDLVHWQIGRCHSDLALVALVENSITRFGAME